MIALGDEELHRFDAYGGFLIKKLFIEGDPSVDLRDKVELEYLRIKDAGTMCIPLEETEMHNGAATPGIKPDEEKEYLSKLIEEMNERFGTDFTDGDKIIKSLLRTRSWKTTTSLPRPATILMADMKAVFGEVMLQALMAITMESQDMAEAFSKNEKGYTEFLNDNLLPYVYRKCNTGE